ncbi:potassium voltage-gated channel subfamily KQT member 1-like isoform X3 [Mytilus edulis]|uniref:KCNQ5 n=1 Tax=Mytilus edulis TaxID=6550 RepID=A0A8S3RWH3_MYTED|nr:KCNQ5 [Mytilus edulis]
MTMTRKSNVKLTISVADQGHHDDCNDTSEWKFINHSSDSDDLLYSPKHEQSRKLKFDFMDVDIDTENNSIRRSDIEKDLTGLSKRGLCSKRYAEPRMSLLGKPLNYRAHRKDARVRRLQARIYNFLERPKLWASVIYHIAMFLACVSCLVLSVLATIDDLSTEVISDVIMYIEPALLIWLITEYIVRIWAAGCRSRFQGRSGRFRFMRRPLCIIDLILIISIVVILFVGSLSSAFAATSLRGLRFFQILRMVRMDRRGGSWKLLGSVIWAHRQELLTTLYIGILGLLFFSFLVFLAEKDHIADKDSEKPKLKSFADAIWWGVITLCTVGYGDVVPQTWAGKVIAGFSAILGISFFALPAGILGSGFALKVQQQQRQKHLIRRRVPAAMLIQSLWRCYAADRNSISIATWKPHMIPCPSPTADRQFKNNASFVSRFSTRRRDRSTGGSNHSHSGNPHSPLIQPRKENNRRTNLLDQEEVPDTLHSLVNRTWSHLSLATGIADHRVDQLPLRKDNPSPPLSYEDDLDHSPKLHQITDVDKQAIRALRKIKYFVARRKFKEALRPYDVKDVIEQYSAGHVDMLGRVKNLQCRLDVILGKQGSKKKDVYDCNQSLASRVVKVERSVEDIESKMDLLIDMYKEDRKILLQSAQRQSSSNPPSHTEITSCLKNSLTAPRSILQDKISSEPSTPTIRNTEKAMQRNLSDLGQRIKKRVTYRLLSLNESEKPSKHLDKQKSRRLSSDSASDTDDKEFVFEDRNEESKSEPEVNYSVEEETRTDPIPTHNQNNHSIKGKRKLSSKRREKASDCNDSVCNSYGSSKDFNC